jgi:hypothetical protein
MEASGNTRKRNSRKLAIVIAIAFSIGFGAPIGAYFLIFSGEIDIIETQKGLSPEEKCQDDSRCIPPVGDPPINGTIVTEIGKFKSEFLQKLVRTDTIQDALRSSIEKDSQMDPEVRQQFYVQREKEWISSEDLTPYMKSIIENDISDFLRDNLVAPSDEFEGVIFGEHILTNIFGGNVAVNLRVDNYDQSNDNWWQEAEKRKGEIFARQCDFDSSAEMFSEDIVITIMDVDNGDFLGILNSATPCDVTQRAAEAEVKIEVVPPEDISEIGHYKISLLQQMMREPVIQNALKNSNEKFAGIDMLKSKAEIPWPPPRDEPTPLQREILNNEVSDFLREHLEIESEEHGKIIFPEYIITNVYGANIASTQRTYNYIQSLDEWWIVASQNPILVRHCGVDKSINMSSEDIVIQILDENDKFIGILNAATNCDVVLNRPISFYGDSN